MKICFITEGGINEFWDSLIKIKTDVLCFGFNGMGLVDYKHELDGCTNYFEDLALLSKEINSVVISGCETDTYGVKRLSVVIADKGKILGVSDMVHIIDNSSYECGSGFRVYDTSCGKLGIIVSTDLFFPEAVRVLALCDSDAIISIFGDVTDSLPQVMMRANSYANGIAIIMCARGYTQISDIKGKILFTTPENKTSYDLNIKKDYHLIESRQRGYYKEFNTSY
jgi:predicted amidohydrolase